MTKSKYVTLIVSRVFLVTAITAGLIITSPVLFLFLGRAVPRWFAYEAALVAAVTTI